jgi:hypothetical protein
MKSASFEKIKRKKTKSKKNMTRRERKVLRDMKWADMNTEKSHV